MKSISINRADTEVSSTVENMQVISVLRCESRLEVESLMNLIQKLVASK